MMELINNIPSDWEITKLKYFSKIFGRIGFRGYTASDLVDEGEGAITLGPPNIVNQKLNLDNKRYLSWEKYDESPEIKVYNGDLLLVKTASVGKVALVENLNEPTTINPQLVVFKNININSKFFYYTMVSDVIQFQIAENLNGGVISTLSQENIQNYVIPLPKSSEQQNIVDYLDTHIDRINNVISLNEKLISLLNEKRVALINQIVTQGLNPEVPMKDSGIGWIKQIPEHWKIEKIKNITQVKPSNIDKKSKDNEPSVFLCNYTDVYNNEFITMDLDFMKATASYDQIRKLSLDIDDIIITKDSESADDIAVPAIVTEDLNNVVCGYHLAIIRPNKDVIYPKYLFRSFESDKINKQFEHGANGVTRFGLGTYPISNAYVCLPPLDEQKEIANYLDYEISKIFTAIDKIKNHIILLDEYKNSLIYHVITGKRKVTTKFR